MFLLAAIQFIIWIYEINNYYTFRLNKTSKIFLILGVYYQPVLKNLDHLFTW